jgi:hypothetical protein
MLEIIFLMIVLLAIFSIFFWIFVPLISALILWFIARLFKFKKTDYKTALFSILIVFGIMIATHSIVLTLFLRKLIEEQILFITLALAISFIISFIVGFFVIYKFYKESILKCILVWLLTCIVGILLFTIIVIIIVLIFMYIF